MKTYYKIQLIVLLFLQGLPFIIQGQITFQKVYPSFYDQEALDVLPTSDGGYIMAGMTTNDIINDMDIFVVKTNNIGVVQWANFYGGPKPEYAWSILETNDNNFFVLGYSQSFGGGDYDTYLLKIDPSGDTLWTKTYGSNGNGAGKEIVPTADGNYIIVGESNDVVSSNYDAYLMKINPSGDTLWTKNYGGSAYESGNSVKQCLDGGFIFTGQTFSFGQGGGDAYLVKTNSTGDTTWTKTFGGTQYDEGMFLLANNDGSYTFVVRDSSSGAGNIDVQVIKTNSTGTPIWNRTYGGDKKDTGKMIQSTNDGGYIIAAISRSFGWIKPDMWIVKIDSGGDTLWTRHYGGSDNEHCYSVRQTSDGGFTAIGHTESQGSNWEIMFLKLNPIGNLGTYLTTGENTVNNTIDIYPNPSNDNIHIDWNGIYEPGSKLLISNTLGQEVFSEKLDLSSQNRSKIIDLKGFEPGVYVLTIQSTKELITKKIILQ